MTLVAERATEPSRQGPEALFKEARQRRRRRWLITGVVLIVILGGLASVLIVVGTTRSPPVPRTAPSPPPASNPPITGEAGVPEVAWVDYSGFLHIGDLSGLTQRVVASAHADPTASLVSLDGRVFWVQATTTNGPNPTASTVFSIAPGTGRKQRIAFGSQVFASLDRSFIYVEWSNSDLAEYWPDGAVKRQDLRIPRGWYLSDAGLLGNPTPVVANGILVESAPVQVGTAPSTLAIWNPSTGDIHTMGKVWKVIGTYTAPGAQSSLVAWAPAACELTTNCSLQITDTESFSSRLLPSPLGHGFDWGGGFSPDGRELAVFVKSNSGSYDPMTQLALVNVGSGSLRFVPGAEINIGDSLAWAQWLPDGNRVIVGGVGGRSLDVDNHFIVVDNHFIVDARTAKATPFRFIADGNQDVNFSVVVVSSR